MRNKSDETFRSGENALHRLAPSPSLKIPWSSTESCRLAVSARAGIVLP